MRFEFAGKEAGWDAAPGRRSASSVDLMCCAFYTFLSRQAVFAACLTISGRSGRFSAFPGGPLQHP